MAKKYPASVYSGIHRDDENSWGMCCSYEAACRCAEEHYDINRKDFIKSSIKMGDCNDNHHRCYCIPNASGA